MTQYSYCESVAAVVWHIRPIGNGGLKRSGGADTLALCGMRVSWDVNHALLTLASVPLQQERGVCKQCVTKFNAMKEGSNES